MRMCGERDRDEDGRRKVIDVAGSGEGEGGKWCPEG